MAQLKEKNETRSAKDLVFDRTGNWRNHGNLQVDLAIPTMRLDIERHGRIITPLVINGETNVVYHGNRRGETALEIFNDPKAPHDLVEQMKRIPVRAIYGIVPGSKEEMELRFDDGGYKPLSKSETIRSFFMFLDKCYDLVTIYLIMYQTLARFTGKTEKISQVESRKGADRAEFLRKWFKGTCEQYLMYAYELGREAQTCLILSELAKERELTTEEKAQLICKLDRSRVKELRDIQKDKDATDDPRERVLAKMQEYGAIDRGETVAPTVTKRWTEKEVEGKVNGFGSDELRLALTATGAGEEARKARDVLGALDHELAALKDLRAVVREKLDGVKDANVKVVLSAFLYPSKDVVGNVSAALVNLS